MTGIGESETLMTAEELLLLRDDGRKYELVNGRLRVSEPPGVPHGYLQLRLGARLTAVVEAAMLGVVFVEGGVVLRRGPDTVRGPDVAFVAHARMPDPLAPGYFEGAPDLAIEIVSPGDAAWEVAEKVEEYLAAGTHLVWVVDPKNRIVVVHTPERVARVLRLADTLDGGDVVPGFRLTLAELFASPGGGSN
jgi:Uma2 family endonuclease